MRGIMDPKDKEISIETYKEFVYGASGEADPLRHKMVIAFANSQTQEQHNRLNAILHKEEMELDPTTVLLFKKRYITREEMESINTQSLELDAFYPDLAERQAVFDRTTYQLGILVDHYDELVAYHESCAQADLIETTLDEVIGLCGKYPAEAEERLAKAEQEHPLCALFIELRDIWDLYQNFHSKSPTNTISITRSGREINAMGVRLQQPKRPQVPLVLQDHGVPLSLIEKMTYPRLTIRMMYKTFRDRAIGAKYPHLFKRGHKWQVGLPMSSTCYKPTSL